MRVVPGTASDLRRLAAACGVPFEKLREAVVNDAATLSVAAEGDRQCGYSASVRERGHLHVRWLVATAPPDRAVAAVTALVRAAKRHAEEAGLFGPIRVTPFGDDACGVVLFSYGGAGQAGPAYLI